MPSSGIGCAHPTIQSYIHGKTEPGPTFLLELNRICGVRWEWLVAGDGSMTAEEESELERRLPNKAREALSRHLPLQEGLHTGEMEMAWEAVAGYFRWMRGNAKERSLSNEDQLKAAETVARAIISPLEELRWGR